MFPFYLSWDKWVIYFKRAAKIHSEHMELQKYILHMFPKDSCRMHSLMIAALWNIFIPNLGQTLDSDWNPTPDANFLLKGIFICTICTNLNIYLHMHRQKVPVKTPLNNMFLQSCPLQNKFIKCFSYSPEIFSDSKTWIT